MNVSQREGLSMQREGRRYIQSGYLGMEWITMVKLSMGCDGIAWNKTTRNRPDRN